MIGRRSGVPRSGAQLLARGNDYVDVAPARAFSCLHILVGNNLSSSSSSSSRMFRTLAVQCAVERVYDG